MSDKKDRPPVTANPKRPYAERQGKLMTPAEAGDYLGVTERQIRRLVHEGQLPCVYVGGLLRIHADDIEAYIDRRRVPARNA